MKMETFQLQEKVGRMKHVIVQAESGNFSVIWSNLFESTRPMTSKLLALWNFLLAMSRFKFQEDHLNGEWVRKINATSVLSA